MPISSLWPSLAARLGQAATRFLNQDTAGYELLASSDMARLHRGIRKGDVLLVQGRTRIGRLIQYSTRSPWSHCALYIGDELLHRGGRLRDLVLTRFGARAHRLLIEALVEDGVVAVPVDKYADHNVRLCRASRIKPAALGQVVDSAVADLGKLYDSRNLLDLALLLLSPIRLGFLRTRTAATCLGHCTEREVICSGMIAKAFQRAGYSVSPQTVPRSGTRHYSRIVPRDFDLSPNFHAVTFMEGEGDRSSRRRRHPTWRRLGLGHS
jgi:hypothetical protein